MPRGRAARPTPCSLPPPRGPPTQQGRNDFDARAAPGTAGQHATDIAGMPSSDLAQLIQELTDQMRSAAAELQFELAARLRDEISDLKKELRQMMEATK